MTAGLVMAAACVTANEEAAAGKAFALDLYRTLAPEEGNVFFSPFSIETALGMALSGARGDTALQMAKTMGREGVGQDEIVVRIAAAMQRLNAIQEDGDIRLAVANSLWPQSEYPFLPEYTQRLRDRFGAESRALDYRGEPEASRQTINRWVEQKTEDRIKDLLPPGSITPLTRMVLANAIYFKGDWKAPFDEARTRPMPFHVHGGAPVDTPTMHQSTRFMYLRDGDVQVVELPYEGDKLSMLVLLPRERDGWKALEKNLTVEQLDRWVQAMRRTEVRLWLPRFEMTQSYGLNAPLRTLGIRDAFVAGTADFSGMDGTRDLFITSVVHKAFVAVDEKGTEAAAATGIVVGVTSMPMEPPPEFRADRPFVFAIRERATGAILFMGRVSDPRN